MVFRKKEDALLKVNKSLLLALLWPLSLIHLVRASRSQNMFCRLPTFCHRRHISKTPFHTFHFHHFCQHQWLSSNIICDRKHVFSAFHEHTLLLIRTESQCGWATRCRCYVEYCNRQWNLTHITAGLLKIYLNLPILTGFPNFTHTEHVSLLVFLKTYSNLLICNWTHRAVLQGGKKPDWQI